MSETERLIERLRAEVAFLRARCVDLARRANINHGATPLANGQLHPLAIMRAEAFHSQRSLAEQVGMMTESIRAVESGRNNVRHENAKKIAAALGVSRDEFYRRMGMKIPVKPATFEGRHIHNALSRLRGEEMTHGG